MTAFNPVATTTWADNLEQMAAGAAATRGDDFYTEMMIAAAEMLLDFVTGTVVLMGETITPNPDDDFAPGIVSPYEIPRNAVVLGYSSEKIDGLLIQVGDKRIIMDASDLADRPFNNHTIKIDGEAHQLINVKPIPAAGVTSVYILQARTGN